MNEGGSNWSPKTNDTEPVITETKIDDWVPLVPVNSTKNSSDSEQKKFIPLVDFATKDEVTTKETTEKKVAQARSIVFPYVYERKNDPRTRYIPLIPEEDLGLKMLANKERKR